MPPARRSLGEGGSTRTVPPYSVVWWDPRALDLEREGRYGLRQEELVGKDAPAGVVANDLAAYVAWRNARDAAVAAGKAPSLRVRTVTEFARELEAGLPAGASAKAGGQGPEAGASSTQDPSTGPDDIVVLDLSRDASRPSGARFGALVHAVLALVPLDAGAGAVGEMAGLQARILGAPPAEVAAAAEVAVAVLAHDVMRRARAADAGGRCRRESPLVVLADDGMLLEGTVDLAFEEGGRWVVVDFKTDREIGDQLDVYRRQVRLYADVISRATGVPADAILMRI